MPLAKGVMRESITTAVSTATRSKQSKYVALHEPVPPTDSDFGSLSPQSGMAIPKSRVSGPRVPPPELCACAVHTTLVVKETNQGGSLMRGRFGVPGIKTINALLPHLHEDTGSKVVNRLPNVFDFRKCIFPDRSLAPLFTLLFTLVCSAH